MSSSIRAPALHSGACLRACKSSRARCAPATALPRREAVISGISLLTALNVQSAEAGVCGAANLCNYALCHSCCGQDLRSTERSACLARQARRARRIRPMTGRCALQHSSASLRRSCHQRTCGFGKSPGACVQLDQVPPKEGAHRRILDSR